MVFKNIQDYLKNNMIKFPQSYIYCYTNKSLF